MSLAFPRQACAQRLSEGLHAMELTLPDAVQHQLLDYLHLLDKWNQAYNLTAIRQPLEMVDKHLLDSLSLLPHVSARPLLDVGAGAGLPGLVLAMTQPEMPVTLVDAVAKKVQFMQHVVRSLHLTQAQAVHTRVEALQGSYDQITSRAFARLTDFVTLTRHLLNPGGRWLAMKGQVPHDELQALPHWVGVVDCIALRVPSALGDRHLILLHDKETP